MNSNTVVKIILIASLALGLSTILSAPFAASSSVLFSTPERNDFSLPDFYNMVADQRAVSYLDDNIVIVNIDTCDREDIACILDIVNLCGAAAVGLDVTFADEREGDEHLLEALAVTANMVQPLTLEPDQSLDTFALKECSYYFDPAHTAGYASSALPSKYAGSTIREFQHTFPCRGLGTLPSFAAALAAVKDPAAAAALAARGNKYELINYHSRRFAVLEPAELVDNAHLLAGRVVLLGAMTERSDMHPSSVSHAMPGILIHAHSLATILDRAYLSTPPKWVNWLIAYLMCLCVVGVAVVMQNKIKGLLLRIIQVTAVVICVYTGYWLFVEHSIVIDFTQTLLMVMFGLFAVDIWNGFEVIIMWLRDKLRPQAFKTQIN